MPLGGQGTATCISGFLKAYTEGSENPDADLEKKDVILPKVEKGQSLGIEEVIPEQHFTKPPPRYTEAGLIKKLKQKELAGLPHMLRLFPPFKIVNMPKEEKIKG